MSQQHPITPPPELVEEWRTAPEYATGLQKLSMVSMTTDRLQEIATKAAQHGADQELEACCEWLDRNSPVIGGFHLRIDRRPKPPSLKKQALAKLPEHPESMASYLSLSPGSVATIRRALEALDD